MESMTKDEMILDLDRSQVREPDQPPRLVYGGWLTAAAVAAFLVAIQFGQL